MICKIYLLFTINFNFGIFDHLIKYKKHMATKLLIPILNRKVTMFKGPTWYLSEMVSLEAILTEDYGLILTHAPPEYQSLISTNSKCIRINNVDKELCDHIARVEGTKIAFLLNYFKSSQPIAICFAIQISKRRKPFLDKIIDLPVISDIRLQRAHNYRIRDNVPRESLSEFYCVISAAYEKHPGIILTLDRFNSALFRSGPYDKIIDITIALESLIRGKTELRYKFALFNSWAAGGMDEEDRKKYFNLLISLYDARSEIVHGSTMTPRQYQRIVIPILRNWDEIIKAAENILGYYLLFLYSNGIERWYEHQNNLSLGIERRIV
jgi:hypothetical protein